MSTFETTGESASTLPLERRDRNVLRPRLGIAGNVSSIYLGLFPQEPSRIGRHDARKTPSLEAYEFATEQWRLASGALERVLENVAPESNGAFSLVGATIASTAEAAGLSEHTVKMIVSQWWSYKTAQNSAGVCDVLVMPSSGSRTSDGTKMDLVTYAIEDRRFQDCRSGSAPIYRDTEGVGMLDPRLRFAYELRHQAMKRQQEVREIGVLLELTNGLVTHIAETSGIGQQELVAFQGKLTELFDHTKGVGNE